jgi:hypothetical protein
MSRILGASGIAMATILAAALVFYLAAGFLVGLAFVMLGVTTVQAAPVTIGARILLLPGAIALWPFVVSRWVKSGGRR